MKLQVFHRTQYTYASPVIESFNEVRLHPLSIDGQNCQSFILKVLPASRLSHYFDFFQNYVHFFEVLGPHNVLTIESTSKVTTAYVPLPEDAETVPLSRLAELTQLDKCYDFLQPSQFVTLGPEVWRLALDATAGETDTWRAALIIMRYIHGSFTYTPQSTNVNTMVEEVIQLRRGVCQDFAHLMLGMCRSLKIPARYVSGYLYNGPGGVLQGSQASHAWCEVYLPQLGWRALDPTNNQPADENYVKVAVGRDYADIVPVKGSYKGTREKTMTVHVEVTSLEI
ncbi:transglutaminase family protein [Pedosphaera parvula]|uniref:Transglutaminase domain protein n=1 Tax=Pedosphaera parvula (strain Ellin514) TaxID=320771 RepID=B9XBF1_PEDPL|nr:transglutaminase family protein [Pedosphaera parvula]EEF62836.1 transglutaminase domain protein [Pedosphaera parvula Ellin514]